MKLIAWPHIRDAWPRSEQELQASFDILPGMPLCVGSAEDARMLTEAQMRSSPACFSGRQPNVSPKGVIYRPQRTLRNLHLYTVSSSCRPSAKLLGTQGERTRQGPCAAARRETREESVELPSREELCWNESGRNLSRASLHTAALVGIIAVLSALAVPPPADAAEALPLEFLSRFLVRPLVLPLQCEYGSGTPAEDLL